MQSSLPSIASLLELHSLIVNKSPLLDNPRRAYISENTIYSIFFKIIKAKNIGLLTETVFSNFLFRTRKYCFKLRLALETGFSMPRKNPFQKWRNHRGKLMKQSSIFKITKEYSQKKKEIPLT